MLVVLAVLQISTRLPIVIGSVAFSLDVQHRLALLEPYREHDDNFAHAASLSSPGFSFEGFATPQIYSPKSEIHVAIDPSRSFGAKPLT